MSPRSSARVNSTSVMRPFLFQSSVDCRFPVRPLLLRPVPVEFVHLLVPLRPNCRMAIRNRRLALPVAIGNNANFDLIRGQPGRNNHIFYPAFIHIVDCQQPEPLPTRARCGCENRAFTLCSFRWMTENAQPNS